jgi:hypothetical protein
MEREREVIEKRTTVAMQASKRQGGHIRRVVSSPQSTEGRLTALRITHTIGGTADVLHAKGLTSAIGDPKFRNTVARTSRLPSRWTPNPKSIVVSAAAWRRVLSKRFSRL